MSFNLEKAWLYAPQKKKKKRSERAKQKAKAKRAVNKFQRESTERATPAEQAFKGELEALGLEYQFQKVFSANKQKYIVDFYLPEYHMVVEIDGEYHNAPAQQEKDAKREADLLKNPAIAKIVRFTNGEVKNKNGLSGTQILSRLFPVFLRQLQE